jgi:predicted nucleic acid-binding Zn ribbon protein
MMPKEGHMWTVGKRCKVCGDTIFTNGEFEWCSERCENDEKKVT